MALKISFINEIAGLCEKVGADITEVARGMGLDPRIGSRFLAAGVGWGGSCFPKDTAALLAMGEEHGHAMPIVAASREVNFRQRLRVVERLQEVLKGVRGRVVGVLGLAFKPGTDNVRESPALDVVRILIKRGTHVRVHDPVALDNARRALEGLEVEFFEVRIPWRRVLSSGPGHGMARASAPGSNSLGRNDAHPGTGGRAEPVRSGRSETCGVDLYGGGPVKSALVTGGAKFIGSHLVDRLLPRAGGLRS